MDGPFSKEKSPGEKEKEEIDEKLKKYYYDVAGPAFLAREQKFLTEIKKALGPLANKKIKEFLLEQPLHSMYKRRPRRIVRRPMQTFEVFNTLACDLLDLSKFSSENPASWALIAVDMASKFWFLRALKQKSKECMVSAFSDILQKIKQMGHTLKYYFSDRGLEFISIKNFMSKNGVEHYFVTSELKCSTAEAYVKLAAQKIYRIMTFRKSAKWVEFLPMIEKAHNQYTKIGKYTPAEIVNNKNIEKKALRNNALILKKKLQKIDAIEKKRRRRGSIIEVGDRVRVLDIQNNPFEKSTYTPKFSSLGVVEKVFETEPLTYQVSSKPRKKYYKEQLSLTREPVGSETEQSRASYIFIQKRKKPNSGRLTRSGKVSNEEFEFLIRGIADPSVSKYISETDFNKMNKNGLILET